VKLKSDNLLSRWAQSLETGLSALLHPETWLTSPPAGEGVSIAFDPSRCQAAERQIAEGPGERQS
jgi:hypothetical protein